MEITDLSWNENLHNRFNNPLLPRSIRGLIVGKSGSGKTTLLLNLLLKPGWLDYDNLFIFGKSLFQPEYKILRTAFEEGLPKEYILRLFNMRNEIQNSQIPPSLVVKQWVESLNKTSDIKSYFFESASDVPDPRELNSEDKNLMILVVYLWGFWVSHFCPFLPFFSPLDHFFQIQDHFLKAAFQPHKTHPNISYKPFIT